MDSAPCSKCGQYHEPGKCPKPKRDQSKVAEVKEELPEFSFDPETGLSTVESEIIKTVDLKTAKKLMELETSNLSKRSDKIVGFRVEDIVYFLSCLKQGFFPTKTNSTVRHKHKNIDEADQVLYATTNLNSLLFYERFPHYPKPEYADGKSLIHDNITQYGEIARIQAIYRNFFPFIKDQKAFHLKIVKQEDWDEEVTAELFWQIFFNFESGSYKILWDSLDKTKIKIDRPTYNKFLKKAEGRAGIFMGIKNEALDTFSVCNEKDLDEPGGTEVGFNTTDGQFPTSLIDSFESLGEFEDNIIEHLKQNYNL